MTILIVDGVEVRYEPTPEGMVDVMTYHPHTTPWDCHGGKEQRETIKVLADAGITGVALTTRERRVSPQGTGPGSRVRFGDDMMAGVYRVAVAKECKGAALAAINAHREAIHRWLHAGAPMPDACRS